jgi:hypothetical protein
VQPAELLERRGGQQVRAGHEQLAELDEHPAGVLEGLAGAAGQLRRVAAGDLAAAQAEQGREAVTGEHPGDLECAGDDPGPPAQRRNGRRDASPVAARRRPRARARARRRQHRRDDLERQRQRRQLTRP